MVLSSGYGKIGHCQTSLVYVGSITLKGKCRGINVISIIKKTNERK